MAALDLYKEKIKQSGWSLEDQGLALFLLPKLGKNTLAFLDDKLASVEPSVAEVILNALADGITALGSIKDQGPQPLIDFLNQAPKEQQYNFGVYIIPLVLDLKQLIELGRLPEAQFSEAIKAFLSRFFTKLPTLEACELIRKDILYLLAHQNLLYNLQLRYVIEDGEDKQLWNQPYLQALEQNEQRIGVKDIVLQGQIRSPIIKYWLDDYLFSRVSLSADNDSFLQAQYLHSSVNVKTLTDTDRAVLTEVLKLYNWLSKPLLTEAEVDALLERQETKNIPASDAVTPDIETKLVELKSRKLTNPE